MQAGQKSGPPRLRPCLRAVWAVEANVAGLPPSGGSPARFSFWGFRWCFYVCCCLSYLCFWPGLVAGLPVWWCLWLVAVPACSVALALCSGGGFCLSVCSGICAGLFLACWCAGRSAGGGSVQIKIPHRVTSPVGISRPTSDDAGPKRQHARRQRRTAYESESEAKHTGAAPVGGFLRR